ncbi:hypothetical protein [Pseudaestuariivita atlantica]|uniref:Uncharacterized protein n=1 Tax=Pseudaestuariivita atlantica TaxID=1317121 RepID=A0A0L1JSF8_9RHOB|nr:hypothetical protein [Pseudaestuariivita atlantica]KNG94642.1 hypothetical protein ATO11_04365 [Pseudaestuariivita atlantica]
MLGFLLPDAINAQFYEIVRNLHYAWHWIGMAIFAACYYALIGFIIYFSTLRIDARVSFARRKAGHIPGPVLHAISPVAWWLFISFSALGALFVASATLYTIGARTGLGQSEAYTGIHAISRSVYQFMRP